MPYVDADISINNVFQSTDDSVINVVAIDSGSGSIKIGIAHVDRDNHEITDLITNQLAIKLAQDLESHTLMKEILESGYIQNLYDINDQPLNMCALFNPDINQGELFLNAISPMCSKAAHDFLEGTYANKFSEAVKDSYIKSLSEVVRTVTEGDTTHPTEVWLVGTAALRKADDGQHLINALAHKLDDDLHVHTNFKIISQQDEGIYAFEGAVAAVTGDPDKVISWDIGGGSMQITGINDDQAYEVLGGTVASSTFLTMAHNYLIENGIKNPGDSIYPLDAANIENLVMLAMEKISFPAAKELWLAGKKNQAGVEILGVGNIHSAVLAQMKQNFNKSDATYNLEEIHNLLDVFANKTAEEIKQIVPRYQHDFINNLLINAILVTATMQKYNIESVHATEATNVSALLRKVAHHK